MSSETISTPSATPWHQAVFRHAQAHPLTTAGFSVALLAVLLLLMQSLWLSATGQAEASLRWALMGGMVGFASTALGALPALLLRDIPQRIEDSMLGFAAGMMLAAAAFALILPGIEVATTLTGNDAGGVVIVIGGMALGVLLMLGLDQFIPHEHDKTGPCGPGHENCQRIWLFVFAIALHNLPEGMAIGVGFSQQDLSIGLPLTAAIALQNLPEGLAVAMIMVAAGFRPTAAVLTAAATGLLEPVGAILGVGIASGLAIAYPVGLGLAGGAMLFVVSHEVIPETHRNGHQTVATIGLVGGFALMLLLDTLLG